MNIRARLIAATAPAFAFRSARGVIEAAEAEPLPSGTAESLGRRLARALGGAATVIAGAMPFDYAAAEDRLWRAEAPIRAAGTIAPAGPPPGFGWALRAEPSREEYARSVARALRTMAGERGAEALVKIVLARGLVAESATPIDEGALLARLSRDPAATAFRVGLGEGRAIIGASPELLISKAGARIASHPLAGSAKRRVSLADDAAAAAGLGRSEKDRREHGVVVDYILDTLSPLCRALRRPEGMALTSTASMWHLGTRIEGELRDADMPVPLIAALLHPTPAVCGLPKARAAAEIPELEGFARGFFAGSVGWCDAKGDGAWFVTLRCAEIAGRMARLFAGAGIVPGSDPEAEADETGAKFGAMLAALGIERAEETMREETAA